VVGPQAARGGCEGPCQRLLGLGQTAAVDVDLAEVAECLERPGVFFSELGLALGVDLSHGGFGLVD
jgi:hypothetical protein